MNRNSINQAVNVSRHKSYKPLRVKHSALRGGEGVGSGLPGAVPLVSELEAFRAQDLGGGEDLEWKLEWEGVAAKMYTVSLVLQVSMGPGRL